MKESERSLPSLFYGRSKNVTLVKRAVVCAKFRPIKEIITIIILKSFIGRAMLMRRYTYRSKRVEQLYPAISHRYNVDTHILDELQMIDIRHGEFICSYSFSRRSIGAHTIDHIL